jgi:hypothetical protein
LTFFLFAASLSAGSIAISANGTFNGSAATSTFSAPNETYSFAFTVATNPAVSSVLAGAYFNAAFSGFTYFLNGSAVAITPADISFFSASDDGGLNICFLAACTGAVSPSDGIVIEGNQMYVGLESAPTMTTGSYTTTALDLHVTGGFSTQPNTTVQAVSSVPEPSTFLMLGAGLLALAGRRVYRRRPEPRR